MLYSYQDILLLAQKPVTRICSLRYHEMNYSKFEIKALKFSANYNPVCVIIQVRYNENNSFDAELFFDN
jgi:hypothetical protein